MSAPNTNLETQKKRHQGPLSGMRLLVVAALVGLAGLAVWLSASADEPVTPAEPAVVSN